MNELVLVFKNFTFAKIKNNKLLSGSLVVFVGSIIVGFGNYLYQIIMSRMLGPENFGILASLLSISLILAIPTQTINLYVSKKVCQFATNNEHTKIRLLRNIFIKKLVIYSLIFFSLVVVLSPIIMNFLKIHDIYPILILAIFFLFSFIIPVNIGILTGLEKFFKLSITAVIQVIFKITFGVLLVWFGFGINGAMIAIVLTALLYILLTFFIEKLPKTITEKPMTVDAPKLSKILSGIMPTLLTSFSLVLLYNVDIILVKHFFEPRQAGLYAIISLLGKIIFFSTSSIGTVLYPISTRLSQKEQSTQKIFYFSIATSLIISLFITLLYTLIPTQIINILFGNKYLEISAYAWLVGLVFTCYSFINIYSLFNLAKNRLNYIWVLFSGTILQVILICYYHANISQILYSMLVSMLVVVVGFICLSLFNKKSNTKL